MPLLIVSLLKLISLQEDRALSWWILSSHSTLFDDFSLLSSQTNSSCWSFYSKTTFDDFAQRFIYLAKKRFTITITQAYTGIISLLRVSLLSLCLVGYFGAQLWGLGWRSYFIWHPNRCFKLLLHSFCQLGWRIFIHFYCSVRRSSGRFLLLACNHLTYHLNWHLQKSHLSRRTSQLSRRWPRSLKTCTGSDQATFAWRTWYSITS